MLTFRRTSASPIVPMILVGNGTVGGVEESVLSTVTYLRRLKHRVLVGVPYFGEFAGALLQRGLPPENLLFFEMGDHLSLLALAQLVETVRIRNVTLLHGHLLRANNLVAAAGAHAGIPAVATLHGVQPATQDVVLHTLFGLKYLAVSEASREAAVAQGISADSVRVLRNGVDSVRFDPEHIDRNEIRRQLGVASDRILVTCVARLSWEKYPEGFVEAALLAIHQDPRLVFALAGTGPLEYMIRRLTGASGRERQIHVLGHRTDIPQILAATDIVVLTSSAEGLPLALLEAMSMARPVVATNVGGVDEAIQDGCEGFLVPAGNSEALAERIHMLAQDADLRRLLGCAGRRKVLEAFQADQSNAALLTYYAEELN